jgi:thiamine pyrophosphate-dependent acetolactate synthase large subunit-like protein
LSLPIVVLDDGWLSLIRVKQDRRRFGLYGTDLGERIRMDPPAHYFGVPTVAARSADELARALRAALAAAHPTVIEAEVDPSHYLDTVYD